MKIKFYKAASLVLGVSLLTMPLSGCNMAARNNRPGGLDRGENVRFVNPVRTPGGQLNNMDMNIRDNNDTALGDRTQITPIAPSPAPQQMLNDMRQRSMNISSQLTNMAEIDQANAIITGNTCLVAYSPSRTAKDVNARKNMVINKVKQIDPAIQNVVVSESQDVMNGITRIMNDMANNRPMNEVNQDIVRLVKKVAPVVS
ncbi:MAG: YhcN/YlaJ family sporulation lipoprotein [Bacillota bacterium]